jgi:hypothetical protein
VIVYEPSLHLPYVFFRPEQEQLAVRSASLRGEVKHEQVAFRPLRGDELVTMQRMNAHAGLKVDY